MYFVGHNDLTYLGRDLPDSLSSWYWYSYLCLGRTDYGQDHCDPFKSGLSFRFVPSILLPNWSPKQFFLCFSDKVAGAILHKSVIHTMRATSPRSRVTRTSRTWLWKPPVSHRFPYFDLSVMPVCELKSKGGKAEPGFQSSYAQSAIWPVKSRSQTS